MGALDLAVEVGRGRANRSELNRGLLQPPLDAQRKEFASTVGLKVLNRKRYFLHDALEKSDGVNGAAAREETEHPLPRAIVHRYVVVQAWRNFADVHLHLVARNRTAIALRDASSPASLGEPRGTVSTQHFVNCRETESDLMKAHQLVAQALNTQLPGASKVKDQRDFLRTGPLPRRSVRPSTLALQAGETLRLITAKPLAERGARDAAAPADEPCVSYSFMQTDPSQALPLLGCEQVVRHGAQHPNPSERMYANPTSEEIRGIRVYAT